MTNVILIFFSLVSQMKPGTAEMVIENRQSGKAWVALPLDLPLTDGYIAVQDCNDLGAVWWAANPMTGTFESFLAIDCARPENTDGAIEWMEKHEIHFEVDYETAVRWNTVGRGVFVEWTKENPNQGRRLGP